MSEQWAIENDTGADLTVRAPNGFAVELDANSADPRERFAYFAIRQQARDLEQLRAELAAAVAERDEARTAYQVRNTEWHQHELIALALAERYKLRADQSEARLAAIDNAPTLCWQDAHDPSDLYWRRPDPAQVDTRELIARPAKDKP